MDALPKFLKRNDAWIKQLIQAGEATKKERHARDQAILKAHHDYSVASWSDEGLRSYLYSSIKPTLPLYRAVQQEKERRRYQSRWGTAHLGKGKVG